MLIGIENKQKVYEIKILTRTTRTFFIRKQAKKPICPKDDAKRFLFEEM
jgi:hypothetical protein